MGAVDGPGLRSVVFFQGCGLRCQYCHNPDTWQANQGGELWDVPLLMKRLKAYAPYWKASGGGVTASGGEPLLQRRFLREWFTACKAEQIHTTVDTAGFCPLDDDLKALLDVTDLVILDIKHLDNTKHRALTGQDNHHALALLDYLREIGKPVWIRQVIVSPYTDSQSDMEALATFLRGYPNIQRVELLPYHSQGRYKWEKLGLVSELAEAETPSRETMRTLTQRLAEQGLPIAAVS
jgi:pyruvate formate lyase activating enzyme